MAVGKLSVFYLKLFKLSHSIVGKKDKPFFLHEKKSSSGVPFRALILSE